MINNLRNKADIFSLLYVVLFCLSVTLINAKPQVIVDTDVNVDDLWAIAYLAKSTVVDMVAITTSNNGWSDSIYAVPNVLHLLQQLGCSANIPIAYGAAVSILPPTYYYGPTLPNESSRLGGEKIFSCLNQTLDYSLMGSSYYAPELIISILANSATPVDFLILGSSTNLANAIIMNPSIISKIGTIYVSGSSFTNATFSNQSFPYSSKTFRSSWNIFVDPLAMSMVLRSGANIRFFSSDAQFLLPLNYTQGLAVAQKYNVSQFLQNLIFESPACAGLTFAGYSYWDPSAAAYYEQVSTTGTSTFCTVEVNTTILIDMLPDGGFGRSLYGGPGHSPATVCLAANNEVFVDLFWSRLGEPQLGCPAAFNVVPAVTTLDLQKQVQVLQQSNSDLKNTLAQLSRQVEVLSAAQKNGGSGSTNTNWLSLIVHLFF